jgi:hypothetical protein
MPPVAEPTPVDTASLSKSLTVMEMPTNPATARFNLHSCPNGRTNLGRKCRGCRGSGRRFALGCPAPCRLAVWGVGLKAPPATIGYPLGLIDPRCGEDFLSDPRGRPPRKTLGSPSRRAPPPLHFRLWRSRCPCCRSGLRNRMKRVTSVREPNKKMRAPQVGVHDDLLL